MASVLFVQNIFFELIGTMSLSACLKQRGHRVDLVIETAPHRVVRRIRDSRPDVVAFSTVTGSHKTVLEIATAIKQSFADVPIVIGGAHPTFFPDMIEQGPIDIVRRGEGGAALADLLDRLDDGSAIDNIPNLWVKKGNEVVRNDVRPLVEDVDSLPFPTAPFTTSIRTSARIRYGVS